MLIRLAACITSRSISEELHVHTFSPALPRGEPLRLGAKVGGRWGLNSGDSAF